MHHHHSSRPAREDDPNASDDARVPWRVTKTLWPYLWSRAEPGQRPLLIIAIGAMVAAKLVTVLAPVLYREVVDALAPGDLNAAIAIPFALILAYSFARLGAVFFQEMRELAFVPLARRVTRRVCVSVFSHLHSLSLRFHISRRAGSVIRALERGRTAIGTFLQFLIIAALPNAIEVAFAGILLTWMFGIAYGAIVAVTVVGYTWYTLRINEWRTKFRREMNKHENLASSRAVDSLINAEVVQSFGNESVEIDRYDEALAAYEKYSITSARTLALLNLGQAFIIGAGQAALLILSTRQYALGEITLGSVVMVNTYLVQLYGPLNFLGTVLRALRMALTDLEDLFKLLSHQDKIEESPNAIPLKNIPGEIEFCNLGFSYRDGQPVLSDLSFKVPARGKVAVVGASGGGKSTVTRLMMRFEEAGSGELKIAGRNIKDYKVGDLRAAVAIVPQDTVMFNESIAFNIGYGKPGARKKEIVEVAKKAELHDFIMTLPCKYDTVVGERGLKLSGGQRQRVAIARALIRNHSYLILDEATSALDTATEKEIQKTLDAAAEGRTSLMIAHRLSTVVDCDRIIVLDEGRAVESGSHRELMKRKGRYYEMWTAQQKRRRTDDPAAAENPGEKIPDRNRAG